MQRIHLQPRVICHNNLSRCMPRIFFCLLARVVLKRKPVLDHSGREANPGMLPISIPCGAAAPAKSRTFPGFEVAIKIRRMM